MAQEQEKFWDNEEVVGEVVKSEFSKYVIAITEKNGKAYISIREFFCTRKDPNWTPTRQGMNIPAEFADVVLQKLGVAASLA